LAGLDGTFGSRFDDPEATYRVLYASSHRLGCYLETLARFSPDLSLFAELAQIAAFGFLYCLRPPGTRRRRSPAAHLAASYSARLPRGFQQRLRRYPLPLQVRPRCTQLALFEPFKIDPQQVTPIDPVDAELQAALAIHGLLLVTR